MHSCMKRLLSLALIAVIAMGLCACGTTDEIIDGNEGIPVIVTLDAESMQYLEDANNDAVLDIDLTLRIKQEGVSGYQYYYLEDGKTTVYIRSLKDNIEYNLYVQFGEQSVSKQYSTARELEILDGSAVVSLDENVKNLINTLSAVQVSEQIKNATLDDGIIQIGEDIIQLPIMFEDLVNKYGFTSIHKSDKIDAGKDHNYLMDDIQLQRGDTIITIKRVRNLDERYEKNINECLVLDFEIKGYDVFLPGGLNTKATYQEMMEVYGEFSYTEGVLPYVTLVTDLRYCFESSDGRFTYCSECAGGDKWAFSDRVAIKCNIERGGE